MLPTQYLPKTRLMTILLSITSPMIVMFLSRPVVFLSSNFGGVGLRFQFHTKTAVYSLYAEVVIGSCSVSPDEVHTPMPGNQHVHCTPLLRVRSATTRGLLLMPLHAYCLRTRPITACIHVPAAGVNLPLLQKTVVRHSLGSTAHDAPTTSWHRAPRQDVPSL